MVSVTIHLRLHNGLVRVRHTDLILEVNPGIHLYTYTYTVQAMVPRSTPFLPDCSSKERSAGIIHVGNIAEGTQHAHKS